jgi:hypothetical protein
MNKIKFQHIFTGQEQLVPLPKMNGSLNSLVREMTLKHYVRIGKGVSNTEAEKFLLKRAASIKEEAFKKIAAGAVAGGN